MNKLITLVLLLISGTVYADTTTQERPEIRWCLDNFNGFHEFRDNNLEPVGPSVNLVRHLASTAGFTLTILPKTPAARCLRQLQTGEADMMTNLLHKPERAEYMHMVVMGGRFPESLIMLSQNPKSISTPYDLTKMTLLSVRGYRHSASTEAFLSQSMHGHIIEARSIENGLEMLVKGRGDVLLAPSVASSTAINEMFDPIDFKRYEIPLAKSADQYVYIGFSKASVDPQLVERINQIMTALIASGEDKKIFHEKEYRDTLKSVPLIKNVSE